MGADEAIMGTSGALRKGAGCGRGGAHCDLTPGSPPCILRRFARAGVVVFTEISRFAGMLWACRTVAYHCAAGARASFLERSMELRRRGLVWPTMGLCF
jgi:hypothetical protein